MLTFTQLRGLSGKEAYATIGPIGPFAVNAGVPVPATPNGTSPGTISTVPTVTVVSTPGGATVVPTSPTATPPGPPPDAQVMPWPPSADVPTMTTVPGMQPKKKWLPWAIGGGVVAAIGTAIIVAVANR